MKIKYIILFVRLHKMLNKFDKFVPVLNNVPRRGVSNRGLYQHYGRIVLAKPNPNELTVQYFNIAGNEISKNEYEEQFKNNMHPTIGKTHGLACGLCDFARLGLPCRCDFKQGLFKGYYKVIYVPKQNVTSVLKPGKILIKP